MENASCRVFLLLVLWVGAGVGERVGGGLGRDKMGGVVVPADLPVVPQTQA
jgi:hypothetical protein